MRSKTLVWEYFKNFPSHNKLDMLQIPKKIYPISEIDDIWFGLFFMAFLYWKL